MKEFIPYWQKLQDPRWQKRRLEILKRDDHTCQLCGATDTTLNVHHAHYIKGREPWEYEDDLLKTLCRGCHEKWHESQNRLLAATACLIGMDRFDWLVGFAKALAASFANDSRDHGPPPIQLASDDERRGAALFEFLGAVPFYTINVNDPCMETTDGLRKITEMNPHLQPASPTGGING